ncbi:hypothetical protein A3780_20600 [Kosakonia radicincitans]|nr:hypothetical protein A3780_20600 [Kosakonia radicincitans]
MNHLDILQFLIQFIGQKSKGLIAVCKIKLLRAKFTTLINHHEMLLLIPTLNLILNFLLVFLLGTQGPQLVLIKLSALQLVKILRLTKKLYELMKMR